MVWAHFLLLLSPLPHPTAQQAGPSQAAEEAVPLWIVTEARPCRVPSAPRKAASLRVSAVFWRPGKVPRAPKHALSGGRPAVQAPGSSSCILSPASSTICCYPGLLQVGLSRQEDPQVALRTPGQHLSPSRGIFHHHRLRVCFPAFTPLERKWGHHTVDARAGFYQARFQSRPGCLP